ncbi:MAG TPA: glycosyl hydrolase family protein [Solirubrobacteraceae bacterium]|nr:glycosyl hydrolase family protein [Solirubrobacteraceae bacterium]
MKARKHQPWDEATQRGGLWHPRRSRVRRRLTRALAAIAALLALAVVVVPLIPPDSDGTKAAARPRGAAAADVTIALAAHGKAVPIPASFLGLSTEYWALPRFEQHPGVLTRVLSMLHVPGDGPLVLRVGGDSADHTFWEPTPPDRGHWVFGLTPQWVTRTGALVRHSQVKLIIDLNLLTGSPFTAARWVSVADRALPDGAIAGFEIGNEPDIYSRTYWLAIVSHSEFGAGMLPQRLSATQYASDFVTYAKAIRQIAPRVPLLGPALAHPSRNAYWLPRLLSVARADLSVVTAHRYPFSACAKPRSRVYPTIARILSEEASAGMASAVAGIVRIAHKDGLPLRLTEMNSVTCGGRLGVSDTFATALWAPDALFELLRVGVDGVNVHVRAEAINAAFIMNNRGLSARPLLYGLAMFARALGPHGSQLEPLRIAAVHPVHVKAWAVRTGSGFHVLLINKGGRSASVALRLPTTAPANVQRLTAPSASSPSGVTLAGQQLGADGRWHGPRDSQTIAPTKGAYRVTVPAISAALVRVSTS